jgi:hypothetical protein
MSPGAARHRVVHRDPRRPWPRHDRRATLAVSKGGHMSKATWRSDDGMATVEYALVTVAAAAFAGVLIALLKTQAVRDLLMGIVKSALGG